MKEYVQNFEVKDFLFDDQTIATITTEVTDLLFDISYVRVKRTK